MTTTGKARNLISEMKLEATHQNNGVLIDAYRALAESGRTEDSVRLSKAILSDELQNRNRDLRRALDAWEVDLETTESPRRCGSAAPQWDDARRPIPQQSALTPDEREQNMTTTNRPSPEHGDRFADLDYAAEHTADVLPSAIAEIIADRLRDTEARRTNDLYRLTLIAEEIRTLIASTPAPAAGDNDTDDGPPPERGDLHPEALADARRPVWSAVVELTSVEAVVTAMAADEPGWAVSQLIGDAVRAAVAAVAPELAHLRKENEQLRSQRHSFIRLTAGLAKERNEARTRFAELDRQKTQWWNVVGAKRAELERERDEARARLEAAEVAEAELVMLVGTSFSACSVNCESRHRLIVADLQSRYHVVRKADVS